MLFCFVITSTAFASPHGILAALRPARYLSGKSPPPHPAPPQVEKAVDNGAVTGDGWRGPSRLQNLAAQRQTYLPALHQHSLSRGAATSRWGLNPRRAPTPAPTTLLPHVIGQR